MNMSPYAGSNISPSQVASEQAAFMRKVYAFMSLGLAITGLVAIGVASSDDAIGFFVMNPYVFYGLLFVQLAMVWSFSAIARRTSAIGAGALFVVYAAVTGLTFSVIFLVYTEASIASTFLVTGGMFGVVSAFGYVTKRDLTGVGNFAMMGLVGVILASIVNFFMQSPAIYWITSCVGVVVFVGLTAYDTQKIRALNVIGNAGSDEDHKEAIHGALVLYLDFINLFLFLLRLLGRRR
jgi:FtsH-binding integral membrane protein